MCRPNFTFFCWRAARGILPTQVNVAKRGVNIDKSCPRCQASDESIFHDIVCCLEITHVWILMSLEYLIQPFDEWFANLLTQGTKEDVCKTVFLMHQIWQSRNELIWDNKAFSAHEVWRIATRNLSDWEMLRTDKQTASIPELLFPLQKTQHIARWMLLCL